MNYYITYGEFQEHMKAYYQRTGHRVQFPEMIEFLYQRNMLHDTPSTPKLTSDYDLMSDEDFNKLVDTLPITLDQNLYDGNPMSRTVMENDIIPTMRDVYVIRHPRYTRPYQHRHNYFEIDYVASGQGTFIFEKQEHVLHEGELCIIAPNSYHDFLIEDESTVFSICLRQSSFNTTFFSLLTKKDLLAYFFRTILQGNDHSNYLLFFTKEHTDLTRYFRHMVIECSRMDAYSNACCISYINLMFSSLLRNYSQTIQFYDYEMGTDFSLVLQYIQHNYQALTLSSLAAFFHYSEPYLCTLIKQNTGLTFTELIKQLRLADATHFLSNTDMKIGEIAEQIGYHSADHFSRVFRSSFHVSPQEYRRQHKVERLDFIPFAAS